MASAPSPEGSLWEELDLGVKKLAIVLVFEALLVALTYLISRSTRCTVAVGVIVLIGLCCWYWERRKRKLWESQFNDYKRTSARIADKISGSEFEFVKLAEAAKESLFVVGPNLNYLVSTEGSKALILQKARSGVRVRVLVANPSAASLCETLSQLGPNPKFKAELDKAITELRKWKKEADTGGYGAKLKIKTADVMMVALIFVDADTDLEGRLLVTPLPTGVEGERRPCFLLEKRSHRVAFDTFYDQYQRYFERVAEVVPPLVET